MLFVQIELFFFWITKDDITCMLGRVIRNHAQEKMIRCRVNLGVVGVRGLMGFLMYMSKISLC